jgi:integrase
MGILTDKTLASLKRKPAEVGTTYDVADGVVPGLFARVSPKGRVSFILYTRYPGSSSPSRRTVGVYDGGNLAKVRKTAQDWLGHIAEGRDPAEVIERRKVEQERKRANSFRAVFEDFAAAKLSKERGGKFVERDMRKEFLEAWNGRPITEILPEDIAQIITAKAKTAPGQARALLVAIKRMFEWSVDRHAYALTANPAARLKADNLCGEMKPRDRKLSDAEVFAFLRTAQGTPYPAGPVYELLLLTGLRLNEVAEAQWSEFDFKAGTWTIPGARMKARESRARPHAVPLTPEILAVINRLPRFESGEFLFSNNFGKTPVQMGTLVKRRLDARMLRTLRAMARKRGENWRKVKLEPWVQHDLRRVVRAGLAKLGVGYEVGEALLAHRLGGVHGTYNVHDYFEEKKKALQQWAAHLRTITEPAPANVVKLEATRA